MQKVFVSCDIIGHSKEKSLLVQRNRIVAINEIVRAAIVESGATSVVWASGGDGGHVAFDVKLIEQATNLIVALRRWSISEQVPLRIIANCGEVDVIEGADKRVQLVGAGINLAGRLLHFSNNDRVLVTDDFRELAEEADQRQLRFHERRTIEPVSFPLQTVWLASLSDEFASRWDVMELQTDNEALRSAKQQKSGLDVIYRAKRLLEVNGNNSEAKECLRQLAHAGWLGRDNLMSELLLDREFGEQYIRGMQLIERNTGNVICQAGDEGQTMFFILRGELAGYLPTTGAISEETRTPDFTIAPGHLTCELAFALERRRTATLQCSRETALLSFSHSDFMRSLGDSGRSGDLQAFLQRKLHARMVEHVCNSAVFLVGKRPSPAGATGPLASASSPWFDLLPHFRLIELDWTIDKQISAQGSRFGPPGVYILLSGTLVAEDGPDEVIDAEAEPVLWANLPGELVSNGRTFRLKSNAKIGAISEDGLKGFGVEAFRGIVDALRCCLPPSTAHGNAMKQGASKRFRVALSFPGEHRAYVGDIASALAQALTKDMVFYDRYYEAELSRPNLDTYLQDIYHDQSELVVVVLSKEYDEKEWCGLEFRAIRSLIKQRRDDEVMFVRVGEGDVTGVLGIDGYVDAHGRPAADIAEIICQRLKLVQATNP